MGDNMRLFSRIQLRYKNDSSTNAQFFDLMGDDFPSWENPSFTVVDMNVGLSWKQWEISVNVENLFDEQYYIDAQELPNFAGSAVPGSPLLIIIGSLEQPRRIDVSLRYNF